MLFSSFLQFSKSLIAISNAMINITTLASPNTLETTSDINTAAQYLTKVEMAAQYVNAYVIVPILVVGVFGNVSTIYIFLKHKNWERGSIHYFFALAFSDLGCIVIYGTVEWMSEGLEFATGGTFYFDLINHSAASCKALRYLWNVCSFISAWLIVSVSAERFIATRFPLKCSKLLNTFRRKLVISTVIALGAILFTPISVFVYDVMPIYPGATVLLCTLYHGGHAVVSASVYFKLGSNYPLPVITVIVLNVLIIWSLVRARRENQDIRSTDKTAIESKVAKSLLMISTIFLITMTPAAVTWLTYFHVYIWRGPATILTKDEQLHKQMLLEIGKLANSMSMINYSVNFIIYSYSFNFYKSALWRIVCCCCGRCQNLGNQSNGTSSIAMKTEISTVSVSAKSVSRSKIR
jgi:hypothetical protein